MSQLNRYRQVRLSRMRLMRQYNYIIPFEYELAMHLIREVRRAVRRALYCYTNYDLAVRTRLQKMRRLSNHSIL
jgi:hypothetical protein